MAASVGATVASQVLGHTEAEKAFRPWWDKFEDQLIYGLITLGKIQYSLLYSNLCTVFPYIKSGDIRFYDLFRWED